MDRDQTTTAERASIEGLEAEITILAAHIAAATYRFLVLLERLDREVNWGGEGTPSAAHWLNWKCGMGLRAAYEHVRVARALPKLAKISAGFRTGELSFSKVRAMTRVATPENEERLVGFARGATAWHVEELVRKLRSAERGRENETAQGQFAARSIVWWHGPDGSLMFKGQLPAEQGAAFVRALQMAKIAVSMRAPGVECSAEHLDEADGVEGSTHGGGQAPALRAAGCSAEHSGERAPWVKEDREPVEAGYADALAFLGESFLSGRRASPDPPLTGGDRYLVQVHVDESALPTDGDGARCHIDGGTAIAAETARRIACDCSRVCVHEDADGEILSVGRKTRQIPAAIRRALRSRDGGCRFPGCTNRRFVDGHHVRHWADGGETSLANLVSMCRRHHRLVHEGGYGVAAGEAGFEFTRPDGSALRVRPVRVEDDVFASVLAEIDEEGIEIDADTIGPREWFGEKLEDRWSDRA